MDYTTETGKAYGFFDCDAEMGEINSLLPTIKEVVKTPEEASLYLFEGIDDVKNDLSSMDTDMLTNLSGFKYVLKVEYEGVSNGKAADEVSVVLNQIYQTDLFKEGEPFRGEIVFEENGEYVFRE